MLIARLIADPASLESRLDAMTAQLAGGPTPVVKAALLNQGDDVLQIESPGSDEKSFGAALRNHFPESDAIVSTALFAIPRVFISDMDSTMIGQECIDELADFAGLKSQVAEITERAMQGELDFEDALRERVELLSGLDESAIEQCLAERIRSNAGARILVETLKSFGCRTVLVTGGFHHFADKVAEELGFDHVVGNRLEVNGGKLTGRVAGAIVDSSVKKAVLQEEAARFGAGAVSMAAGDGANDIPMLEESTYGVAYRAKPKAQKAANGWVEQSDLTSLLKLLAIPKKRWAV